MDGNVTAAIIKEDTNTNRHIVDFSSVSGPANKTRTLSIYAKTNGRRYLQIWCDSVDAFYDLVSGTVTDVNNGSGTATSVSTNTAAAVNGFYKCTVSFHDTAATIGFLNLALSDVADNSGTLSFGDPSYTGDNVSGIWMWQPKWVNT